MDDRDQEAIRKREIAKSIKDAFNLFDKDGRGTCDVREIGTIVRHLGICPTEIELRDMITEIEEEEPTGFIRFERFDRMMMRVLLENQYPRDSEEKLLRAFRALDPDNKGYVEAEKVRTLLTTHGERFSQEEIDDFLHFAVDAECVAHPPLPPPPPPPAPHRARTAMRIAFAQTTHAAACCAITLHSCRCLRSCTAARAARSTAQVGAATL